MLDAQTAATIGGLNKVEMAERAEALLARKGWLPAPRRIAAVPACHSEVGDSPVPSVELSGTGPVERSLAVKRGPPEEHADRPTCQPQGVPDDLTEALWAGPYCGDVH